MITNSAEAVAAAFTQKWEASYNSQGAVATAKLYTADRVLVGFVIAVGQAEITKLLGGIIAQGWNKISIRVVNARETVGVVLAACEYEAIGSGPNAGKVLHGRSSYVLSLVGPEWLCVLHTAA